MSKSGKHIDRRTRRELEARGLYQYEGPERFEEYCRENGLDPDRIRPDREQDDGRKG